MNDDATSTSTRPYLIRALHEWCSDNGFTPYLVVKVNSSVRVPHEYVRDGEITLNISYDATGDLELGNDYIEFKARFGGRPRDIVVPVERIVAIYARETGQGMSFAVHEDEHPSAADQEYQTSSMAEQDESTTVLQSTEPTTVPARSSDNMPTQTPTDTTPTTRPIFRRVK